VPANGDDLVFPLSAQNRNNVDNIPALSVQSITFTGTAAPGSGYRISGTPPNNPLIIGTGGISDTSSSNNAAVGIVNVFVVALEFGTIVPVSVASARNVLALGNIQGTGGLTKDGAGEVDLLGLNSVYTGPTKVIAGRLQVANKGGPAFPGDFSVQGGILGGDGQINGAVTVAAGGTLAPGATIQGQFVPNLTTNAVDLNPGANFAVFIVGSSPPVAGVLSSQETVDLAGATLQIQNPGSLAAGQKFVVLQADLVNGMFANAPTEGSIVQAGGQFFQVSYLNNLVTLTVLSAVPQADLQVTKEANAATVLTGGAITYTVKVANQGPNDASNVTLTDMLPPGVVFDSAGSSQGDAGLSGDKVIANLGTLTNGASASVTIVVTAPLTPGPITNTATVTALEPDPNPANNTRNVIVIVEPAPVVHFFAVGSGPGMGPLVRVFNPDGTLRASFFAFAPTFTGGVTVGMGDVNGDGTPDIIAGAGIGVSSHIKVIDGTKLTQVLSDGQISDLALLGSFFAFDLAFRNGVTVSAGDVNGDGLADVIVGACPGAGPHVKVIDATRLHQTLPDGQISDGALLASFFAFGATFAGGVSVGAGDVNGDGRADIVVGAGAGAGPHVKVVDATMLGLVLSNGQISDGALLASFFAYNADSKGGVFVAAGDLDGDGRAEIITGPGAGPPQVKIFAGAMLQQSFFAYDPAFAGGVRVGITTDTTGHPALLTGAGPGAGPHVVVRNGSSFAVLDSFFAFAPDFIDGTWVAGS
jgi:uncharacterized repeat protein (TIGR01451 family)